MFAVVFNLKYLGPCWFRPHVMDCFIIDMTYLYIFRYMRSGVIVGSYTGELFFFLPSTIRCNLTSMQKIAASKRQKSCKSGKLNYFEVGTFQVPTIPTSNVCHLSSQDGLLATLLRHDVETTYGCKVNGLLAMQQVGIGWEVKDAIVWFDGCTRRGEGRLLATPQKVA